MKYSRKPLVLDIHRVEPVGDEVDNIDKSMLSCSILHLRQNIFIQETQKRVRQETIYLHLHLSNKSEATLGRSGCLRSEATLGPSVCLSSTPVITRPVVCFLQMEPQL
jgi:hypothetical protein